MIALHYTSFIYFVTLKRMLPTTAVTSGLLEKNSIWYVENSIGYLSSSYQYHIPWLCVCQVVPISK